MKDEAIKIWPIVLKRIQEMVDELGNKSEVGRRLGVAPSQVNRWLAPGYGEKIQVGPLMELAVKVNIDPDELVEAGAPKGALALALVNGVSPDVLAKLVAIQRHSSEGFAKLVSEIEFIYTLVEPEDPN